MARIGEDVSERLDVMPAQLRVLVTRRPRYACRRCSRAVAQAHASEHVVPGGLPTEVLIAQVMVARFGDHLPFYRQAEIYTRQGITLDRATLGNWGEDRSRWDRTVQWTVRRDERAERRTVAPASTCVRSRIT
jgi:transposase